MAATGMTAGRKTMLEAILESDLPHDVPLWRRAEAMYASPTAFPKVADPLGPFGPNMGYNAALPRSTPGIWTMDPELVNQYLSEYAKLAEEHNFPMSLRGLTQIEATDPGNWAHVRNYGPGRARFRWDAGFTTESGIEGVQMQKAASIGEGWSPGTLIKSRKGEPVARRAMWEDPWRSQPAHEFGHVQDASRLKWMVNDPAIADVDSPVHAIWQKT